MKDGIVLFYCEDGVLYPVALDAEQQQILEITARLFSPLRIVKNRPQGKAVNLLDKSKCPHGEPWDDCPDCRH